jgi:DNA-binding FadR family transcriptional regulator
MTPPGRRHRGGNTLVAKRSQPIIDDYLRKIVTGELREGQLLPTETVLIEQYHVSRTAVREAIQVLATRGFVTIRQGSGSTVAPRSRWNVLDPDYLRATGFGDGLAVHVREAREMLEPALAALAAQRATPGQVATLRDAAAQAAAAPVHSPQRIEGELDFHHLLAECSGNPVLISIHGALTDLAKAHAADGRAAASDEPAAERAAFWHAHIVEAVAAHDATTAQDAMRMHVREGEREASAAP